MESSAATQGKTGTYAFSWSIPATGQPGQTLNAQMPEQGDEVATPVGADAQVELVAQSEFGESSTGSGTSYSRGWLPGASSLRVAGLLGWSAVASFGIVAALLKFGPVLGTQVGTIGGVWAGLAAAIWFLPPRFLH